MRRPPGLSDEEKEKALAELKHILPSAAALVRGDSDTDTASETEDLLYPLPPHRLIRVGDASNFAHDDVQIIIQDAVPNSQQVTNLF